MPSRAVLPLRTLHVSSDLVSNAPTTSYKFSFQDISLYLIDDVAKLWEGNKTDPSLGNFLVSMGFVWLANCDFVEVFLRRNKEEGKIDWETEVENRLLTAYTCSDSFQTLRDTFLHYWDAKDLASDPPTDADKPFFSPSEGLGKEEALIKEALSSNIPIRVHPDDEPTVFTPESCVSASSDRRDPRSCTPPRPDFEVAEVESYFVEGRLSPPLEEGDGASSSGGNIEPGEVEVEVEFVTGLDSLPVYGEQVSPEEAMLAAEDVIMRKGSSVRPDAPHSSTKRKGKEISTVFQDDSDGLLACDSTSEGGFASFYADAKMEIVEDFFSMPTPGLDSDRGVLPEGYPPPDMRVSFNDFSFCWRLFGGSDWQTKPPPPIPLFKDDNAEEEKEEVARREERQQTHVETESNAIFLRHANATQVYSGYAETVQFPRSRRRTEKMIELLVRNLEVHIHSFQDDAKQASRTVVNVRDVEIADCLNTSNWRKFLCYWHHPRIQRESGSPMVHLTLEALRPDPTRPLVRDHRLKLSVLPLRFNVDQDAADFLQTFFAPPTASGPTSQGRSSGVDPTATFFEAVTVRPAVVKIDYKPKHVNYDTLRHGDRSQLINLLPIEGLELTLKRVVLTQVHGWDRLVSQVFENWITDISKNQIHHLISGLQPIRPFANVGAGVADLVLLPMEQYRRGGNVVRGVRKGAASFAKTVTMETIDVTTRLAAGTQTLLEHANGFLAGGGTPSLRSTSKLADQPKDIHDGLQQAYESLSRGVKGAAATIVAVPLDELHRTGPSGYAKSVVRAVPIAIIKPVIGATDAVSRTLLGLRNQMDPLVKIDMDNKWVVLMVV